MECRIRLRRPEEEQWLHGEDCFGYFPNSNVHSSAQAVSNFRYPKRGIITSHNVLDTISHFLLVKNVLEWFVCFLHLSVLSTWAWSHPRSSHWWCRIHRITRSFTPSQRFIPCNHRGIYYISSLLLLKPMLLCSVFHHSSLAGQSITWQPRCSQDTSAAVSWTWKASVHLRWSWRSTCCILDSNSRYNPLKINTLSVFNTLRF